MRKPVASQQTSSLSFGWGDLMPLLVHAFARGHFLQIYIFHSIFFSTQFMTLFNAISIARSHWLWIHLLHLLFIQTELDVGNFVSAWTRNMKCKFWRVRLRIYRVRCTRNAVFFQSTTIFGLIAWKTGCASIQFVNAVGDTLLPFIGLSFIRIAAIIAQIKFADKWQPVCADLNLRLQRSLIQWEIVSSIRAYKDGNGNLHFHCCYFSVITVCNCFVKHKINRQMPAK